MGKITGDLSSTHDPVDARHNYFGNLIWKYGVPALLLYLAFIYIVFRRGKLHLALINPVEYKKTALIMAYISGMFLVGVFAYEPFHGTFLGWCAIITSANKPDSRRIIKDRMDGA
jgi:hypothetical protein